MTDKPVICDRCNKIVGYAPPGRPDLAARFAKDHIAVCKAPS